MSESELKFTHDVVDAIRQLTLFDGYMRALWQEVIEPTHDARHFTKRLYRAWERCFAVEGRRLLGRGAPSRFDMQYGVPLIGSEPWTAEWFTLVHSYGSFNKLLDEQWLEPDDPRRQFLEQRKQQYRRRVSPLSPDMIGSLRTISHEYMLWLQKNPQLVGKVAWEAFEKIVAEIFASRGFVVDLTGRVRNATCDAFAVRTDEFGAETRYLVECKRYEKSRRVTLSIVNQVIGAAKRMNVDHAFLVTTSTFTREVLSQKASFQNMRIHLREQSDILQWLREYKPREDGGLWLAEDWQDSI